jgi:hypothetical protein
MGLYGLIHMAQDMDTWRSLVGTEKKNVRIARKTGNYLSSCVNAGFPVTWTKLWEECKVTKLPQFETVSGWIDFSVL